MVYAKASPTPPKKKNLKKPHLLHERLGHEVVLCQVAAEGPEPARVLQDGLAHEGAHPRGAVEAEQVGHLFSKQKIRI